YLARRAPRRRSCTACRSGTTSVVADLAAHSNDRVATSTATAVTTGCDSASGTCGSASAAASISTTGAPHDLAPQGDVGALVVVFVIHPVVDLVVHELDQLQGAVFALNIGQGHFDRIVSPLAVVDVG